MSFGWILHFGRVKHTEPSVVLSWSMLLQLLESPGTVSRQQSIPSKANHSIRFHTLSTRDICQQKAAGRKLYILQLETSPQTQQKEQFKTKVCGCKSNVPELIPVFSTPLPLCCAFHWWNIHGGCMACRLTNGAWPALPEQEPLLLLVTMSVKDYRHQQSQGHFRKRGWGVEKSMRKGQPRHTDTLCIDLKDCLTQGCSNSYWKLISVFHTVLEISSVRKKSFKSSYFNIKNLKHIFLSRKFYRSYFHLLIFLTSLWWKEERIKWVCFTNIPHFSYFSVSPE